MRFGLTSSKVTPGKKGLNSLAICDGAACNPQTERRISRRQALEETWNDSMIILSIMPSGALGAPGAPGSKIEVHALESV